MNQLLIHDRCVVLLRLGRLDEARASLQHLTGRWRRNLEPELPIYAAEWSRAESVAVAMRGDPGSRPLEIGWAQYVIAAQQASRGELTDAFGTVARALPSAQDVFMRESLRLARVSGRPLRFPPGLLRDTSRVDTLTRALALAWEHDVAGAERLLRQKSNPAPLLPTMQDPLRLLVRALIAEDRQRWGEVVELLAPLARGSWVQGGDGLGHLRWTVACAYERMGRLDSAAVFFERALDPDRQYQWERIGIRMASPFVHQRLVLLYARLGQIDEAERHLTVLERDVTTPDPDVGRMLEEAQAAVRTARGMARPTPVRS